MNKYFFLLCLAFIVAFLSSPFALTVIMGAFVVFALMDGKLAKKWQNFIKDKTMIATTAIFIIIAYSGFYSELTPFYWDRVRVALPFLVLPFAFSNLPKLTERQYQLIFYWLLLIVTLTSIGNFFYYLSDFKFYTKELEHGRPIPTPIHHIRFSLLIAYTIVVGLWLTINKVIYRYQWERWLILGMTALLFIWIHILSVRSGIVVLYATLFLLSLQYVFKTKRYLLGFSVVLLIVAAPFTAYQVIPSFKNRINYAIYDFQNFKNGQTKNFSDGERMISLQTGLEIGNKNPLIGTGIGDLNKDVEAIYTDKYPGFTVKRPHNQFLFFYAATGFIGLTLFLIAFFFPLFYRYNFKDELILGFYIIVILSFMVEATIGNAIGTAYYCFFLLLSLLRIRPKIKTSKTQ